MKSTIKNVEIVNPKIEYVKPQEDFLKTYSLYDHGREGYNYHVAYEESQGRVNRIQVNLDEVNEQLNKMLEFGLLTDFEIKNLRSDMNTMMHKARVHAQQIINLAPYKIINKNLSNKEIADLLESIKDQLPEKCSVSNVKLDEKTNVLSFSLKQLQDNGDIVSFDETIKLNENSSYYNWYNTKPFIGDHTIETRIYDSEKPFDRAFTLNRFPDGRVASIRFETIRQKEFLVDFEMPWLGNITLMEIPESAGRHGVSCRMSGEHDWRSVIASQNQDRDNTKETVVDNSDRGESLSSAETSVTAN
jgi:hypothetical protein